MAKPNKLDGKRLRLISIQDEYTDLKPGDTGVVEFVDDLGQIHMQWDNGGTLALIPEIDKFEFIDESLVSKSKYSGKLMMFESFNLNNDFDALEVGIGIIRKMVTNSNFIKMKYEADKTDFSATLDISFEDGNNTQGIVFYVYLEENMVDKRPYVTSSNPGDHDLEDDSLESHFQTVGEIVEYLISEVGDYIRIEESKRYKNEKRV